MSDLHIENIIKGIASGEYVRKVGSQFGSMWGFDGLLAAEATPEQYAAFVAPRSVRLCHSEEIAWLNRKWSVILAYRGQGLAQVSVFTDYDDNFLSTPLTWLTSVLGKHRDDPPAYFWIGRDGIITHTKTPEFLQLDARRFTVSGSGNGDASALSQPSAKSMML